MSKYIDAEKLKSIINQRMEENGDKALLFGVAFAGRTAEDNDIINIITSLQQEQPEVVKGWVARNRPNVSPSLMFFYDKPIRQDNGWGDKFWHSPNAWSKEISIPANLFPSLQWKDEPIEVELVIRNARKED